MSSISEALTIALQYQQQGNLPAAEQICRQILAIEPGQLDANHLLGMILHQQGRPHEAIDHYRRALAAQPDFAAAHYNLGLALKQAQRLEAAVASYRKAVELKPNFAEAHNSLGVALREQGKLDEAAAACRRAIELRPLYPEAHNNLGVALNERGKPVEAIARWRRAIELNPDFAEAFSNLGSVLRDQGELAEAIDCLRRAAALMPEVAEAHSALGSALAEAGDLAGAEGSFRGALRQNTRFAFAHLKLAELLDGRLPDDDLAAQRRLLENGDLNDAQRLLLHFASARVCDARGDYAAAAAHLERGHALELSERRKLGQEYDPDEFRSLVDRMISVSWPECFERARDFGLAGFGAESELPVFVVGLPRSGTTLIEQILASHSQVFGAGEIKLVDSTVAALASGADFLDGFRDIDRDTAQQLASRHLKSLRDLDRSALRIVDKMPENYFYLGLLAALFPRARLIHCRRDLRDVAVSCWMTHFQEICWASDQYHIASRFHDYLRLMAHWRRDLPLPLLEVDYEETVADLEGVARKIVAWCGLEWEPACLDFHRAKRPVSTASLVQVRQPIFRSSVGRWKRYEQILAPLFDQLRR